MPIGSTPKRNDMVQKFNFAIIPSKAVRERAIEMSEWLSAEETEFVLDGESLHPHVSLYHVSLDGERPPLVIADISARLESIQSFFLHQGPYRAVEDEWIDVSYDRNRNIISLHEVVIEVVGELRANAGTEKAREDFVGLLKDQQNSLLRCGWTEAFERYAPHLTFARLKTKDSSITSRCRLKTSDLMPIELDCMKWANMAPVSSLYTSSL